MLKQVSLSIATSNPLQEVARRDNAEVSVIDCRNVNGKRSMFLLDVSAREDEIEHVISDLRGLTGVERMYSTSETKNGALCVAVLQRPPICQAAGATGVLCLKCPLNCKDEELLWDVLIKDPRNLKNLFEKLEKSGIHARVNGISEARRESALTHRQREVMNKAISLGYFEFPRKIDLTQLAQTLQIKPSSLSEILRSAQRKILQRYTDEVSCELN
jgi:predicted DNA binding protein